MKCSKWDTGTWCESILTHLPNVLKGNENIKICKLRKKSSNDHPMIWLICWFFLLGSWFSGLSRKWNIKLPQSILSLQKMFMWLNTWGSTRPRTFWTRSCDFNDGLNILKLALKIGLDGCPYPYSFKFVNTHYFLFLWWTYFFSYLANGDGAWHWFFQPNLPPTICSWPGQLGQVVSSAVELRQCSQKRL